MGGVAEGEAPFYAGMAVVGRPTLVGHHAHHLIPLHLSLEGAAHLTIGAGGDHAVFRLPGVDHALFHQRGRRAGLHTGTTGDVLGVHKGFLGPSRDCGREAAPVDSKGKGALHFLAGAHAAGADNAHGLPGDYRPAAQGLPG